MKISIVLPSRDTLVNTGRKTGFWLKNSQLLILFSEMLRYS